ncbi:MAG: hypothetical protein ACREOY_05570 [Candidatus Dormibacteraceae bacterium]
MRRIGYVLLVLAALSVIIALVSFGLAGAGSTGPRNSAVVYGIVNIGFALVNAMLGLVLLGASRAR